MKKKSQLGLKMLQEMQTRLRVPEQIQSLFRTAKRSSQTNRFSFLSHPVILSKIFPLPIRVHSRPFAVKYSF